MSDRDIPNLFKRAASFGKSVVRHAADGLSRAADDQIKARLDECVKCPAYVDQDKPLCRLCGCVLSLKATWRSERCPLERWEE